MLLLNNNGQTIHFGNIYHDQKLYFKWSLMILHYVEYLVRQVFLGKFIIYKENYPKVSIWYGGKATGVLLLWWLVAVMKHLWTTDVAKNVKVIATYKY